jgi:hypothetical protein
MKSANTVNPRRTLNVYGRRLSFDQQTLIEHSPGSKHRQGIAAGIDAISEHMMQYTLTEMSSPPLYVPKFLTWAEYVGMHGYSKVAEERFNRERYAHIYQGACHVYGNFVEVSAGFSLYTRDEGLADHFADLIGINDGLAGINYSHKRAESSARARNYQAIGEVILAKRGTDKYANHHA